MNLIMVLHVGVTQIANINQLLRSLLTNILLYSDLWEICWNTDVLWVQTNYFKFFIGLLQLLLSIQKSAYRAKKGSFSRNFPCLYDHFQTNIKCSVLGKPSKKSYCYIKITIYYFSCCFIKSRIYLILKLI